MKRDWLRMLVHLGSLLPLALLIWDYSQHRLTANPIEAATLRTGDAALMLLVLSLACTPAATLLGLAQMPRLRRTLGLYAFMYATIHLGIFAGLDYGLDLSLMQDGVLEKPFVLAGLAAFVLLVPLATTSTAGWVTRLGRRWKWLHRLTYAAALLAVIHYLWLVKADLRPPLTYGAVVILLLALRLPMVRRHLRWRTLLRDGTLWSKGAAE